MLRRKLPPKNAAVIAAITIVTIAAITVTIVVAAVTTVITATTATIVITVVTARRALLLAVLVVLEDVVCQLQSKGADQLLLSITWLLHLLVAAPHHAKLLHHA